MLSLRTIGGVKALQDQLGLIKVPARRSTWLSASSGSYSTSGGSCVEDESQPSEAPAAGPKPHWASQHCPRRHSPRGSGKLNSSESCLVCATRSASGVRSAKGRTPPPMRPPSTNPRCLARRRMSGCRSLDGSRRNLSGNRKPGGSQVMDWLGGARRRGVLAALLRAWRDRCRHDRAGRLSLGVVGSGDDVGWGGRANPHWPALLHASIPPSSPVPVRCPAAAQGPAQSTARSMRLRPRRLGTSWQQDAEMSSSSFSGSPAGIRTLSEVNRPRPV